MRVALTVAVLLAVVSTALVAVCQHSETRRLQRRVWQLERRRLHMERRAERLAGAVQATRTPRRLLAEYDLATFGGADAAAYELPERPVAPRTEPEPDAVGPRVPAGFVTGGNFDGGDR